ncbi:MAG: hypothetical protein RR473_07005 [Comamonas sp.]|uniref:hypothetical protein n=1 Tax=Comamonas sp. lk TaxID=2201272 RepID=UPI000EB0880D|nr:hypothetical protein [Comamonas sp. lk]
MDFLTLLIILTSVLYLLKKQEQRRNTQLLAQQLGRFQIEKLMGSLMEGYLRAVGEQDLQRRAQVWTVLESTESSLVSQFQRFADEFAQLPPEQTRVSTLPLALPYMDKLFPAATMDVRAAMQLHAKAVAAAAMRDGMDDEERKRQAFTMTAELMLMQHTCHWFCKSRTVASMRLIARHKTSYEQVLQSVAANTRQAYQQLAGIRS